MKSISNMINIGRRIMIGRMKNIGFHQMLKILVYHDDKKNTSCWFDLMEEYAMDKDWRKLVNSWIEMEVSRNITLRPAILPIASLQSWLKRNVSIWLDVGLSENTSIEQYGTSDDCR